MEFLLYLLALLLIVVGVVQLLQGQLLFGIVLIVAGVILGPSGYGRSRRRSRI